MKRVWKPNARETPLQRVWRPVARLTPLLRVWKPQRGWRPDARDAWAQIERDEQLRTFQSFKNRFRTPYEQSYSTNPLYYSLDVGPAHIIMMNAVRPCPTLP